VLSNVRSSGDGDCDKRDVTTTFLCNALKFGKQLKIYIVSSLYIVGQILGHILVIFSHKKNGYFHFRAQEVHRVGLRNIGDLWNLEGNCLRPWEDVRDNIFQLEDGEQYCIWQKIVDSLPAAWMQELITNYPTKVAGSVEWLGIFENPADEEPPSELFYTTSNITTPVDSVVLPEKVNQGFDVGRCSKLLQPMGSSKVFKGT
jgi:hypothetical protein